MGKPRKPRAPFPYDSDADKWEQQRGESVEAYEAFGIYARLPYATPRPNGAPGPRSIGRVAEELGKSSTLLERWSRDWRWVERATAFDRAQRVARAEELREAERAQADRSVERRIAFRDKAWGLFEKTVGKLDEMLAFPVYEDEEEVVDRDEDGRPTTVIVRTPVGNWSPAQMGSLLRAGLAAGQLASDDGTGKLDGLIARLDFDTLPDDVLDALETGNDAAFLEALIVARGYVGEGEGGEDEEGEA